MARPSDPVDAPLAEQALGAHQEESERERVREPGFDAAADVRADVDLGESFGCADDKTADDGPGDRIESAQDQHRQGHQREKGERELHAVAGTLQMSRHERDYSGNRPLDHLYPPQRYADGERRLMVVSD